jgi:hypothetical protein
MRLVCAAWPCVSSARVMKADLPSEAWLGSRYSECWFRETPRNTCLYPGPNHNRWTVELWFPVCRWPFERQPDGYLVSHFQPTLSHILDIPSPRGTSGRDTAVLPLALIINLLTQLSHDSWHFLSTFYTPSPLKNTLADGTNLILIASLQGVGKQRHREV